MHRVEVAHHQNTGHVWGGVREGRAHAVAEAHAAGHALDARAGDREFARRNVHHAVHRCDVVGRALALHPGAQPFQHGVCVERQFGWIHVLVSLVQNAKILPTASGTTAFSPQVCTRLLRARQPVQ